MTDINIQQLTNTQKTDDTNDIAGSASVSPSYITSDVPSVFDSSAAVGVDNVAVSNGVSTSQVTTGSAVEQNGSSNYIQSDVQADSAISDLDDMDSIAKIEGAEKYIDPSASSVQLLLARLRTQGVITDGMTAEQIVSAISNYVNKNFSYVADPTGTDHWNMVSETIQNGGGDCEDLANLTASLAIAALVGNGMSLDEANKKISCVAVVDPNALVGHVMVRLTGDNGSVTYFDPTSGTRAGSIGSTNIFLFSYNSEGVDLVDKSYDYAKFSTAKYTVAADKALYPDIDDFGDYWTGLNGMKTVLEKIAEDLDFYDAAPDFDWSTLGAGVTTAINNLTAANLLVTSINEYVLEDIDVSVSGTDAKTGVVYDNTEVSQSAQWIDARIAGGCTVNYSVGPNKGYNVLGVGTGIWFFRETHYNAAIIDPAITSLITGTKNPTYNDYWKAADDNATGKKAALQLAIFTALGLTNYVDPTDGTTHDYYNELFGATGLLTDVSILDPAMITKLTGILDNVMAVVNKTVTIPGIDPTTVLPGEKFLADIYAMDLYSANPDFNWAALDAGDPTRPVQTCIDDLCNANEFSGAISDYYNADIKVMYNGQTLTVSAAWIHDKLLWLSSKGTKAQTGWITDPTQEDQYGHDYDIDDPNDPNQLYGSRVAAFESVIADPSIAGLVPAGTGITDPAITNTTSIEQAYETAATKNVATKKSGLQEEIFTKLGLTDYVDPTDGSTHDYYEEIYGNLVPQLAVGLVPNATAISELLTKVEAAITSSLTTKISGSFR